MIADHLGAAIRDHRLLESPDLRSGTNIKSAASHLVEQLQSSRDDVLRDFLISRNIAPKTLALTLDQDRLAEALGVPRDNLAEDLRRIKADFKLRRRGVEAKLVIGQKPTAPDPVLLRTLRDAHRWVAALKNGVPLGEIARGAGHHEVYIQTRSQLAFLSPRIQRAIADGTLPPEITQRHLVIRALPLDWTDQERLCGLV